MKTVLITGASRGIGRSIAIGLKSKGYTVVANYNKSEKQAMELKEQYNIDIYKANVTNRDEVKSMIQYCLEKYGKIDVLVNNAGISQIKLFTEITDEDWNNMINTNLTSAFLTSQEAVKNMIHNKNGCIINISSMWGEVGASCETHYSAAKSGLNGLTKAMAKELGLSNIRVNAIAPGVIDTDMNKELNGETINELKQEIPLNKIGKPEDICKCVEWLIEDNYTTGQIISINGGMVIK